MNVNQFDYRQSHDYCSLNMGSLSADLERQRFSQTTATASFVPTPPTKIDPLLALELRLRWLEALILGVKQDLGRASLKHGETVSRLAETVQRKLNKAVQDNEGLKKFVDQCTFYFFIYFPFRSGFHVYYFFLDIDDQHTSLLIPTFVLSDTVPDPPTYDKMSAEELDAYLTEMEPEIRTADRDMLEIEALEKKGVTGAGRLLGTPDLFIEVEVPLKRFGFETTRTCSRVLKQY